MKKTLVRWLAQVRELRPAGTQIEELVPLIQILDFPVPQMVDRWWAKLDDGSSNPKNASLKPTPMVFGPAIFLTIAVLRTVQILLMTQRVWISCVGAAISLLHRTMMSARLMLHF